MTERTTNREALADEAQAGYDAVEAQREATAGHTKGPWLVKPCVAEPFAAWPVGVELGGGFVSLALVYSEQDAHLMAQAPDLRADVERLEGERDEARRERDRAIRNAAIAALEATQ